MKKWTLSSLNDQVNRTLQDRYGKKASQRTIQNDLRYLREQKSAPIKLERVGAVNYFYYEFTYSVKNLPLDDEEVSYLIDAIGILKQVGDYNILNDVELIISKLRHTVSANIPDRIAVVQFEKKPLTAGSEFFDFLFVAIRSKICLRIHYKSFNSDNGKEICCHPDRIKEYRNRWFLLCREHGALRITTLALDRIELIKNSFTKYVENDLFDPQSYFDHMIGVSIPEKSRTEMIDIKVKAEQTPYLLTKPIDNTQTVVRKFKNGDLLLRIQLIENFELTAVLLSFGGQIEVLRPLHLRKKMAKLLKVAKQYNTLI